jgi:hypothetical protein
MKYGIIFGVIPTTVKRYLLCRGEMLELLLVSSSGKLFMRLEILPLPCEYIFTLMNFVVNNQELFSKTLH